MRSLLLFLVAAALEIAGCFSVWVWQREQKSAVWLIPGIVALFGFALALSRVPADFAGRAYAAYGGIYVMASLLWLWLVESKRPDTFDFFGGALCVSGTLIILFARRP